MFPSGKQPLSIYLPTAGCVIACLTPLTFLFFWDVWVWLWVYFSSEGQDVASGPMQTLARMQMLAWDTSMLEHQGQVKLLAHTHTEANIRVVRLSPMDENCMVSCGQNNVRLWRLKGSSFRSCPVDLGTLHGPTTVFSDAGFYMPDISTCM